MSTSQVFDHPSVSAIASYITTLGLSTASTSADAAVSSSEDEEDDSEAPATTVVAAAQLTRFLQPGDSTQQQTMLFGISSVASRTAAGNAVLALPGVDASRRLPFERWELKRQEQVRGLGVEFGSSFSGVMLLRSRLTDATHRGLPLRLAEFLLTMLLFLLPLHLLLHSWLAACQFSLASSWTQWTCLMQPPLASVPPRLPSWTHSSACSCS